MTVDIDTPEWVRDAVFYQIFPDRFAKSDRIAKPSGLERWNAPPSFHGYKGGDLLGVVDRLDWLSDLGVNAIYFNPIFQSGSNHRYHTHDYFTVDPLLGGDDAFEEMLEACHRRGIRVVLDGVFNHSSRGFFRFHDLLENGASSPWADWFIIHDWPLHPYDAEKPANYDAWWGLKALPKFNTDNPAVREYLMQVGEYWARKGIDGWRLDVPEEIQTPGFWEEFRARMRAINPDFYIVGEIWGDASHYIAKGDRFDGTMNYRLTTAIIAFTVGHRVDPTTLVENPAYDVIPAIDAGSYADRIDHLMAMYPEHAHLANLNLLDSHDTARILTIARGDVASVVLANLLLFTFPGAPCIYYGTEVGLAGARDPDCRRAFPWDESKWDTSLLETVKSLVALRHAHPALRSPDYRHLSPPNGEEAMVYAFERSSDHETLIVAVNAGEATEPASIRLRDLNGSQFERIWGDGKIETGDNHARLSIPPRAGGVWRIV